MHQYQDWLLKSLSSERFNQMNEKIFQLPESEILSKAKDIEILALKLDVDQANEIHRGKEFNIINK